MKIKTKSNKLLCACKLPSVQKIRDNYIPARLFGDIYNSNFGNALLMSSKEQLYDSSQVRIYHMYKIVI
jgi:hypothetical protein